MSKGRRPVTEKPWQSGLCALWFWFRFRNGILKPEEMIADDGFATAGIATVFPFTPISASTGMLAPYPNIPVWRQRLSGRPTDRRAMVAGDRGMALTLI